MNTPLLIAHRGDTKNYQENTVEAFESAFSKGADGVEMDIQLIDGQIKVVHDYLYDSKKEYPLFEDILKKFKDAGRLEVEVKAFSTEILEPLKTLVQNHVPHDIEITTSELPLVAHITSLFPNFNVGVNFDKSHYKDWMDEEIYLKKTVELMHLVNAQVVHLSNLPKEKLTKSLVTSLHEKNFKTHYHIGAVKISEQLQLYNQLQSVEIDQCTIDDVELISELRNHVNVS